jgi:FG-GAP repeat
MRAIQDPVVDIDDFAQPVAYGGTGSNTPTGAANKLKLVSQSLLDSANGVPRLGSDGKTSASVIPDLSGVQQVNIKGSRIIAKSVVSTFEISDYDGTKTYDIAVSAGQVVRNGNIISVTAPAVTGNINMTVNGRVVVLTVVTACPGKPTFYTPTPGTSTGNSPQLFYISDYFYIGDASVHASTDWQICLHPDFVALVAQSLNDTVNKTAWVYTGLTAGTQYYVRARFRDANGNVGEWSNVTPFKVRNPTGANLEETYLYPADLVDNQAIGQGVSVSDDGRVVAVGSPNNNSVYVFRRNNRGWTMEQRITALDSVPGDGFGSGVRISGDGLRIFIPAANASVSSVATAGALYVFAYVNGFWSQEAKLSAGDKVAGDSFGRAVACDSTGTRIVVGSDQWPNSNTGNNGKAYVFLRTGTSWAQEAKLVASDGAANARFGAIAEISRDNLKIAVTAIVGNVGAKSFAGSVYIFARSGTTWSQEQKLVDPSPQTSGFFGSALNFTQDYSRLFIGSYGYGNDTTGTQTGRAAVFIRSGSVWSLEQIVVSPSTPVANLRYGIDGQISKDGNTLYIGETRFNNGVQGYVHIFTRSGSVWTFQKTLIGSIDSPTGNANFGTAISLSANGAVMAVAATNGTTTGKSAAGRVYIFS